MKTILAFLLLTASAVGAEYKIGPEYLPSYVDHYDSKLVVPAGETVTLSGVRDIDAIEVLGTLNVPGELSLKYINLTVAESGKLIIGTPEMPNTSKVEFIKKDAPLDTDFDPFQWGHGIQVFGEWTVQGKDLGATWSGENANYQPSDWNIVFKSENPTVTNRRGHTVVVHTGKANVRYASFVGLGRTTGDVLDNTSLDKTHIGTNQIAKYAFHWHHVAHEATGDHAGGHLMGCYLDGLNGNKWGVVIHGSHDMHVENNVVANFTGSCIVTEDGNEFGYLIKSNLCTGSKGNGISGKFNMLETYLGKPYFAPGAEGAGIWLHSPTGTTIDNLCKDCRLGYQMMYRPNPNRLVIPPRVGPTKFADNKSLNNHTGFEEWNSPDMLIENLVCENCTNGVVMGSGEAGNITLLNPQFTGSGTGFGVHSARAYTTSIEINGGKITGFSKGISDAQKVSVNDTDLRGNALDIWLLVIPFNLVLDSAWFGTLQFGLPTEVESAWDDLEPRHIIKNRNGDGKNYILCASFQDESQQAPSWPVPRNSWSGSPKSGLTRKQVWEQYHIAPSGVLYGENAVELPGIANAKAIPLTLTTSAPPRAVLLSPNELGEPTVVNGKIRVYLVMSGDREDTGDKYFIQFDEAPIQSFGPRSGLPWHQRIHDLEGPLTDGTHTVRTWRQDASGSKIESSLLEFRYTIGDNPPPPPEPVWSPANVGPPFAGDVTLRVRNGVVEKLQ